MYRSRRAMTTEEKFNAAVNVIRSLPKNGELMVLIVVVRLRNGLESTFHVYVLINYCSALSDWFGRTLPPGQFCQLTNQYF